MPRQTIPARSPSTVTREVGDEFVVLDTANERALCLNGAAADVWRAAGTVADVDKAALDALLDANLFDEPGISRRTMLRRTGFIVGGVGIASIVLPMAEAAASGTAGLQAITLSPTSGPRGTTVTVAGTGFFPSGTITTVTIGGITVTPSSTTISGTGAASFTFVVPAGVATGVVTVSVTDNHNNTATKPFTVTPVATMSKTTFNKNQSGQTFTLTGTGFAPNSTVTITAPSGWTRSPITVPTTATGTIASTTITVGTPPGNSSGNFVFTDTAGNTDTQAVIAN